MRKFGSVVCGEGDTTMLATTRRGLKTIVISRNNLFREGLQSLLAGTSHEVHVLANNVDDLKALTADERDGAVVLLDNYDDIEQTVNAVRWLGENMPEIPVIVLSSSILPPLLAACLSAGASGYLLMDISFEALVQSLELVALGEKVFPTQLAALFISEIGYTDREMAEGPDVDKLSERQRQILECLVKGASNKVIARRLDITDATVKVHMKGLLRKIHVENRTQAAIWALNHGMTAGA